jgi:hypothetical protein
MIKLYQNEWFGIKFSELSVELSIKDIANVDFYTAFYKEFFKRFCGYHDLPKEWRSIKDEIIHHIDEIYTSKTSHDNAKTILSIGCGTGYVENGLCDINDQMNIVAIEPGVDMTRWVSKKVTILQGLFPSVLDEHYSLNDFDLVFASSIDYVFDDQSYLVFLKAVHAYGVREFLLTELFVPESGVLAFIKDTVKNVLKMIGLRAVNQSGQLWGYLRTVEEHKIFLQKAGFSIFETGKYKHGAYWIMAKYY